MTNAEKFQKVFGYYATEMWAKPEKEFLEWINAEALEQEPTCRNFRQIDLTQNCVKCKHYCETEDETGVHSQCRATCSNNTQVDKLRKAAEETEDNEVRKGILKAIEVLEGDTEWSR